MSNKHIPFEKLSDFFDDEFTNDEKEQILDHIETCHQCRDEYNRLRRTLGYLSKIRNQEIELQGFSRKTMSAIKFREKRFIFYKAVPAIAAMFLIVFGIGVFKFDLLNNSPYNNRVISNDDSKVISDTEKIVNIVRDRKGKIFRTDPFVEGEVELEKFKMLKRVLLHNGFNKIRYSITVGSATNKGSSYKPTRNIEKAPSIEEMD